MYESGWNKLTQAHYAQSEWPEAEVIAPLVQNGQYRYSGLKQGEHS